MDIIKAIPLIHNGWRYFHSEITTSMFGGKTIREKHQRHNIVTGEIKLIKSSDWGKHMFSIMDDIGDDIFNETSWDLDYKNPFVDCR